MHPVAFQFGALTVTWYGILVAAGFLMALLAASRRAPAGGLTQESILDLGPWLIVGAILGARVLYVITFWRDQFADQPFTEWLMVWRGGLVFYGGLIGATLGAILFALVKKIPMWKMGDVVAPSIPLGYAFGRIGCLMNGCCYGKESHLPWAIQLPQSAVYPQGIHPTQVYDALWGLLLFWVLARLYRRKSFDGQIFVTFLLGYSVLRFLSEFLRGDYPPDQLYFGGHVTSAQIVSVGIFVVSTVIWRLLPRQATGAKSTAGKIEKTPETTTRPR